MIKPKQRVLRDFTEWLATHGASIVANTSENEIIRFRTTRGIQSIWVNKNDIVTRISPEAQKAWDAFREGRRWSGGFPHKREYRSPERRRELVTALAKRDGWTCAYCLAELTPDEATIEHMLPISRTGLDELKNLVLACKDCNSAAGNKNIRQKIELVAQKRRLTTAQGVADAK